jgi:anti-anti-sigma factor
VRISTSVAERDVVVVEIEGEVDAHTVGALDETLSDLLAQGQSRLVLDLSRMGFISSPGLRAILFAQRAAGQQGGQVRAFGLSARVRRIFELAALDEVLHLSNTRQEAIEGW